MVVVVVTTLFSLVISLLRRTSNSWQWSLAFAATSTSNIDFDFEYFRHGAAERLSRIQELHQNLLPIRQSLYSRVYQFFFPSSAAKRLRAVVRLLATAHNYCDKDLWEFAMGYHKGAYLKLFSVVTCDDEIWKTRDGAEERKVTFDFLKKCIEKMDKGTYTYSGTSKVNLLETGKKAGVFDMLFDSAERSKLG
ncbi:hypothetical protein BDP27DRAFT_1372117 [Rhodocollybia butyracea]|uniref:Uncharacterized protein n=1 Tax=Rhodocollybia butyracea TaxID=206335 RepID=A0A9P5TY18_9AGAR|nr:hypothetical protein BDP27DRAFT_1372117 [Rhodocollybia butyracea]